MFLINRRVTFEFGFRAEFVISRVVSLLSFNEDTGKDSTHFLRERTSKRPFKTPTQISSTSLLVKSIHSMSLAVFSLFYETVSRFVLKPGNTRTTAGLCSLFLLLAVWDTFWKPIHLKNLHNQPCFWYQKSRWRFKRYLSPVWVV